MLLRPLRANFWSCIDCAYVGKTEGNRNDADLSFIRRAGLPVFALGKSGLSVGPTTGYLIGMVIASYVMGTIVDRGWAKNFFKIWVTAFVGSMMTFTFGLGVLSFFVNKQQLFTLGLLPFLPGDFLKTQLASIIVWQTNRLLKNTK